jgi:hypothetical protein
MNKSKNIQNMVEVESVGFNNNKIYEDALETESKGLNNSIINKDMTRILPTCCLALIASYFHDINEVISFILCNKTAMKSVKISNPILIINNKDMDLVLVGWLLTYLPRVEGLIFKSFKNHSNSSSSVSNKPAPYKYPTLYSSLSLTGVNTNICKFFTLRNELLQEKKMINNRFTLSVSKAFDRNNEARNLLNIGLFLFLSLILIL